MKTITCQVIALLFFASFAFAQTHPRPPNFVVIFCDDLGYGDLGSFGRSRTSLISVCRQLRCGSNNEIARPQMKPFVSRLALIDLFVPAVFSQNNNAVTPGEFIIEPATIHNLGFEWKSSGDDNRNATACQSLVRTTSEASVIAFIAYGSCVVVVSVSSLPGTAMASALGLAASTFPTRLQMRFHHAALVVA
jgi:hypothetical protein